MYMKFTSEPLGKFTERLKLYMLNENEYEICSKKNYISDTLFSKQMM